MTMDNLLEVVKTIFTLMEAEIQEPSLRAVIYLITRLNCRLGQEDGLLGRYISMILNYLIDYEISSVKLCFGLQNFYEFVKSQSDGISLTSLSFEERMKLTNLVDELIQSHKTTLEKLSCGNMIATTSTSSTTVSTLHEGADVDLGVMCLLPPELRNTLGAPEQLQQCPISTGSTFCYISSCKNGQVADKFGLEEQIGDCLVSFKLYNGTVSSKDPSQYWKGKTLEMLITCNKNSREMHHINGLIQSASQSLQEKGATLKKQRRRYYPY